MHGFRSSPGDLLEVHARAENGTVALWCAGELDISVCDRFQDALDWSYTRDPKTLRIDTTDLSFMDSSGLACLIQATNRCNDLGVRFEVVASEPVAKLLDLTGAPVPRAAPQGAPTAEVSATPS